MTPFYIFEGPDGAGKSYIINAICGKWPKYYRPYRNMFIPRTSGQVKALIDRCEKMITAFPNKITLADRHTVISELVYGQILRGKPNISVDEAFEYLHKTKPRIIYIRPPESILLARKMEMEERDKTKSYKPKEHITKVMARYRDIIEAYDRLMFELVEITPVEWFDTSDQNQYKVLLSSFDPKKNIRTRK